FLRSLSSSHTTAPLSARYATLEPHGTFARGGVSSGRGHSSLARTQGVYFFAPEGLKRPRSLPGAQRWLPGDLSPRLPPLPILLEVCLRSRDGSVVPSPIADPQPEGQMASRRRADSKRRRSRA